MGRERFFFNLGALIAAVLLIVAAAAFGPGAVKGVGLGIGTFCCIVSVWFVGAVTHRRRFEGYRELRVFGHRIGVWSMMAGAIATVAVWEVVQSASFEADVSRWLTLANGVLIAILGCVGLVMHEVTTERVVHVLEVINHPDRER
jgi:hypothetical protein